MICADPLAEKVVVWGFAGLPPPFSSSADA
jgi:hypothetical protein